jgi:hypothetical protein
VRSPTARLVGNGDTTYVYNAIEDHNSENRMARDAAKAAGLTKEQRQQLHREISGQRMSFEQIVEGANEIAAGK